MADEGLVTTHAVWGVCDSGVLYDGMPYGDKVQEWTEFMFASEPIAASLRDYCLSHGIIDDSRMYQLIALGFMRQKLTRLTTEWLENQKESSTHA